MTKLKILHYSTHNEDCGIAKYQEQFVAAMGLTSSKDVYNEFFSYSPNVTKIMSHDEFSVVLGQLKQKLQDFDILHIQHELSFYKHDELGRIVDVGHELGKKVVFTVHTAPDAQYKTPERLGYGPRSMVGYAREIRAAREFERIHIVPLQKADLVIVHNTAIRDNLIKHGINSGIIKVTILPVPNVSFTETTDEIKKALNYQKDDVLVASVGFISETKGVKEAVKALAYLPDNYKLALIGGVHPSGGGEKYLDEVCDLIIELGLRERTYITGFVDDDIHLNALIRECDVCIYPYDQKYYQYVSSAALNNSIANHKPAIVYPTRPFVEMNQDGTIAICKSGNYYEMTRYIIEADYSRLSSSSKLYAETYSYTNEAVKLVRIYEAILEKSN
ncbi:glycosyltransferase [Candidatus Saccharibacteria bacterium]|nr:glycosyltransferase [Candidatus Saccharibacteria bacterium]